MLTIFGAAAVGLCASWNVKAVSEDVLLEREMKTV